jgi:DNA-binding NarL/FixJ family response regulator
MVAGLITLNESLGVVPIQFKWIHPAKLNSVRLCDLALVDLSLPQQRGLEIVQALSPVMPTVALVSEQDTNLTLAATTLQVGANGIVSTKSLHCLPEAINTIQQGNTWIDPQLAGFWAVASWRQRQLFDQHRIAINNLTQREQQVLRLLVAGEELNTIADQLGIGLGTVKTHLHKIFKKMQVRDRTQAVVRAYRSGIVA